MDLAPDLQYRSTTAADPRPLNGEMSDMPAKRRNIGQACEACRRAKMRCDGRRPRCGPCAAKGADCEYEARRSHLVKARSRLQSAHKLLETLKSSSEDEAFQALKRLRDARSLDDAIEGVSMTDSSSVTVEMEEHVLDTILIRLPGLSVTRMALDYFFGCSGKLFHIFSSEEVDRCYRAVFEKECLTWSQQDKINTCLIMAIASVGAQYAHPRIHFDVVNCFYNVARHFLEVVIEQQPLDAIKICTLLAMFNIMEKTTLSLAYVETGLALSRRYGLTGSSSCALEDTKWVDYKRTWRTLIFLSSWLSSTLGYVSAYDSFSGNLALSEIQIGGKEDLSEVVQVQMTKICILKSEILRMHLAFKDLAMPTLRSILDDLRTWYSEMPDSIRLANIGSEALSLEAKRSIFHVHLLYLGAIMLLFRRISSHFAQAYATNQSSGLLPIPSEEIAADISIEAISAARTSSRIVKLLLEEHAVFQRCWLVIFQTYISCIITLRSAAQKQLHGLDPPTWEVDIECAAHCLEVLSFCGRSDQLASRFRDELRVYFDDIAKHRARSPNDGPVPCTGAGQNCGAGEPFESDYLLRIPENADPSRVQFCLRLIRCVSQPFADPSVMNCAKDNVHEAWHDDPTRYEHPQLIERLEWDVEKSAAFQWNLVSLQDGIDKPTGQNASLGTRESRGRGNKFLGGDRPNGWIDDPAWKSGRDGGMSGDC